MTLKYRENRSQKFIDLCRKVHHGDAELSDIDKLFMQQHVIENNRLKFENRGRAS